jgi:hypothetical protein
MNKEQQELLDDAYKNYLKKYEQDKTPGIVYYTDPLQYRPYTIEQFIHMINTDSEFSQRWGLKIEERELSLEERNNVYKKQWGPGVSELSHDRFNSLNIPTKLITITYNDKTIESYE